MQKPITLCCLLLATIIGLPQQDNLSKEARFESVINAPVEIVQVSKHHYLIDFGKAYFGTVLIESADGQDDSLIVHLGEKLANDNRIDRNPGGTIRYQRIRLDHLEAKQTHVLALKPDKRNTTPPAIMLPDSFGVIMPFRYCEIENLTAPIEGLKISQKGYHYQFNDAASAFSSSDSVLDAIWDLCKHSIKATSFAGMYVDGDRERIPYEADAFINQLSHYSVDSVYSLAQRTNEYFIDHPTWPTEWILHTVLLFYYDYLYSGDISALEKHYKSLKLKTLMDLERDDGLISSKSPKVTDDFLRRLGFKESDKRMQDIVDWPPAQKDARWWKLATAEGERDGYEFTDINTVVNAFYYRNLVLMAKAARDLGKNSDVSIFEKKSAQVKTSINDKLFDKAAGVYVDGEGSTHASLHANMFPLAFDLVPSAHIQSVLTFIKSRGMACSVYGAQYLLEGLYKYDDSNYAFQLITDTESDRSWWNMIRVGSTITLEAWDMKYKPNLDWNHAWGTAPANIITRYMWGITPASPGFKDVRIAPKLDELTFSKIKTPTIHGPIFGEYRLVNQEALHFEITLPAGMYGKFVFNGPVQQVQLDGKSIDINQTILPLAPGANKIEIRR